MKILAIDTTAKSCSVAIAEDEKILCALFLNDGMKHSTTLMPMVDQALHLLKLDVAQIDLYAITAGPGSFTGLRIGICTLKGLANVTKKPIVALSTLEVIAQNVAGYEGIVCPIMDARNSQVYAAAYQSGKPFMEECAMDINTLLEKLKGQKVLFLGDGVPVHQQIILETMPDASFVGEHLQLQCASSMISLALQRYREGKSADYITVAPNYMRKSQAERMRFGEG